MIMNAYFGLQFPSLRRAADTMWMEEEATLVVWIVWDD
jgi:hypothetical protein